ncbi:siderophore-interacting protein [Streptomyces umbrinus]|uniref:siderophore-interacting protein n=1 Tax=Streptomyces umbrinus TaxID=67370 RepID=UPI0033D68C17
MLSLTVQASEQISPHFMSITLGGDDVQHLKQSGFDQSGRLFFADPDDDDVFLPSSERWILQLTLQSSAKRRPRARTYSIRRFRPQASRAWSGRLWWCVSCRPGVALRVCDSGRDCCGAW